jgi:hypothetical protein
MVALTELESGDVASLPAGVVLATATYLHHTRLLSILAILAAVLASFFTRTIACGVCALVFILIVSHLITSLIA